MDTTIYADVVNIGSGCTRDTLPVREVVRVLTVHYQRRIEYMNYSTAFNEVYYHDKFYPRKAFPQNNFSRNAGKERLGQSKQASVAHSLCGAYCTAIDT